MQIKAEAEHLDRVKRQIEEDRQWKLQEKFQANNEMVRDLHHIDSAKKEAGNKHHKEETNK